MAARDDKEIETTDTSILNDLAKVLNSKNGVCLLIKNQSTSNLVNPQIHPLYGKVQGTLPFKLKPGQKACIGFHRTFLSLLGTVGVVTYDIEDSDKRLCLFYSNPFFGYNSFGLEWRPMANTSTAYELCAYFYPEHNRWFSYGSFSWHEKTGYRFTVAGFMDQGDPAYLHVHVRDENI